MTANKIIGDRMIDGKFTKDQKIVNRMITSLDKMPVHCIQNAQKVKVISKNDNIQSAYGLKTIVKII